ncbi:GDSL esterase/lipase [Hibiscus syriacus]|uniref:GDSL esterase/lipase n=1 Tax=Hibiscus syriacus TaxID=106335 RepID=A0A6A3BXK8_HIBSY|nr:GDSL esterase/lipase [Hibiscus syriacus]
MYCCSLTPFFLWLFVSLSLSLSTATKAKVPAIIVFGDSSVDSGNNNVMISTLLKSNFLPYDRDFYNGQPTGRFCNGLISPDFISDAFGLKLAIPTYLDLAYNISDFTTGVCFTSAETEGSAASDCCTGVEDCGGCAGRMDCLGRVGTTDGGG